MEVAASTCLYCRQEEHTFLSEIVGVMPSCKLRAFSPLRVSLVFSAPTSTLLHHHRFLQNFIQHLNFSNSNEAYVRNRRSILQHVLQPVLSRISNSPAPPPTRSKTDPNNYFEQPTSPATMTPPPQLLEVAQAASDTPALLKTLGRLIIAIVPILLGSPFTRTRGWDSTVSGLNLQFMRLCYIACLLFTFAFYGAALIVHMAPPDWYGDQQGVDAEWFMDAGECGYYGTSVLCAIFAVFLGADIVSRRKAWR